MNSIDYKQQFAARLSEVCDAKGIASGRGRQSALAMQFGVSPNAARKWLLGLGLPELDLAVKIANWGDVNVNWLLQGVGPIRGEKMEPAAEIVSEGITQLPVEDRQQVFDFLRYKFDKADGWFTSEKLASYMQMLDRLAANPPSMPKK